MNHKPHASANVTAVPLASASISGTGYEYFVRHSQKTGRGTLPPQLYIISQSDRLEA